MDHDVVIEKAGHLSCTGEEGVGLELCVASVCHFLAEGCPGIDVNGKDRKDLEGVEAPERGLVWIAGGDEGGQLYEAAAFPLGISQSRCGLVVEESETGAEDGPSEADDRRHDGKFVHCSERSRGDGLVALVADDECWNAVIHGSLAGVKPFVRLDLPGECIRVNTAVHEEPRLLPFRRHNGL